MLLSGGSGHRSCGEQDTNYPALGYKICCSSKRFGCSRRAFSEEHFNLDNLGPKTRMSWFDNLGPMWHVDHRDGIDASQAKTTTPSATTIWHQWLVVPFEHHSFSFELERRNFRDI